MTAPTVGPDDTGSLTIKFGSGFDAPWFVAKGSPKAITAQAVEAFGLTDEDIAGKIPAEVWGMAASRASLAWAGKATGGTPERSGGGGRVNRPNVPAAGRGQAKEQVETVAEDPNAGIFAAIEAAASVDELKLVYAKSQTAFEQEQKDGKSTLRDALKARGAVIKASA